MLACIFQKHLIAVILSLILFSQSTKGQGDYPYFIAPFAFIHPTSEMEKGEFSQPLAMSSCVRHEFFLPEKSVHISTNSVYTSKANDKYALEILTEYYHAELWSEKCESYVRLADSIMKVCAEQPRMFHSYERNSYNFSYLLQYEPGAYLFVEAEGLETREEEAQFKKIFLDAIEIKSPQECDAIAGYDTMFKIGKNAFREKRRTELNRFQKSKKRFASREYWLMNLVADSLSFDKLFLRDYQVGFSFSSYHQQSLRVIKNDLNEEEQLAIWLWRDSPRHPYPLIQKLGGVNFRSVADSIPFKFLKSDTRIRDIDFDLVHFIYPSCMGLYSSWHDENLYRDYCVPFHPNNLTHWMSGTSPSMDSLYFLAILQDSAKFRYMLHVFPSSNHQIVDAKKKYYRKESSVGHTFYFDTLGHYVISDIPVNAVRNDSLMREANNRILIDLQHPETRPYLFSRPKDLRPYTVFITGVPEGAVYERPYIPLSVDFESTDVEPVNSLLRFFQQGKAQEIANKRKADWLEPLKGCNPTKILFVLPLIQRDWDADGHDEFISVYIANGKTVNVEVIESNAKGGWTKWTEKMWLPHLQKDKFVNAYLKYSTQITSEKIISSCFSIQNQNLAEGELVGEATYDYDPDDQDLITRHEYPDQFPYLITAGADPETWTREYFDVLKRKKLKYQLSNGKTAPAVAFVLCTVRVNGTVKIAEDYGFPSESCRNLGCDFLQSLTFKPAIHRGKPVPCQMVLPLVFD